MENIEKLESGKEYILKYTGSFCYSVGSKGFKQFSKNMNSSDRIKSVFIGTLNIPMMGIRNIFHTNDDKRIFMSFCAINVDYIDYIDDETSQKESIKSKSKSIEKYPIIEPGEYEGLWSAYYIVILFKNGKKSDKIKVTQGVRGINCPCKIIVESDGQIYVE